MIKPRYVRHHRVLRDRLRELYGLLVAALGVFIAIALWSYYPEDPSILVASTQSLPIYNWCGALGAQVAAVLYYLLGAASFGVLPVLFFVAYLRMMHRSLRNQLDRFIALCVLPLLGAAWCFAHQLNLWGDMSAGGLFGMHIYRVLHQWLDAVGTCLLLYTLLFISLIIATRLSFVHVVHAVALIIKRVVGARARAGMRWCMHRGIMWGATLKRSLAGLYTIDETALVQDEYEVATNDDTLFNNESWQMPVEPPPITLPTQTSATTMQAALSSEQTQLGSYHLPNPALLNSVTHDKTDNKVMRELETQAAILEEKLARFGIAGSVVSIRRGPLVTLFEYEPDIDAKISKIVALEDDLALALQALSIRIIAPIPGRSVVGFEVANKTYKDVVLAQIIKSSAYTDFAGELPLVLGQDTIGEHVVVDLVSMPHLLVAGATGSGKSVALNTMLVSLLCARTPDELQLILIDPKRLEFAPYADIAHLIFPIITNPRKAAAVLWWVVKEMETRYARMAELGARHIGDYNKHAQVQEKLPSIVVIIDELADLMMVVGQEIESSITRIAQMARAAGIHLIVATQRPSVDVITGLIKANFPSRIAFRVACRIDSRTILDSGGADKLLGRGDMLFLDSRAAMVKRVHGAYVSDKEIADLVAHIRAQRPPNYRDLERELPKKDTMQEHEDELYHEIVAFVKGIDEVSISLLQRTFRIGYNRSARIIDTLQAQGLILPSEGGKTRKVIK